MKISDFFLKTKDGFIPKTPFAAIKAYEAEILPIEYFIYKSASIIPLDEEFTDLEELERILAKTDLSIHANILLIGILEKLIDDPDMEIALFAAESINLLEGRYNLNIEKYKKLLEESGDFSFSFKIARQYYELSLLNQKKISIRRFYLKEAYQYLKEALEMENPGFEYLLTLIKVLIDLEMYEGAILVAEKLNSKDDIRFLFLMAEIEFNRKNYTRVYSILSRITNLQMELDDKNNNLCAYWMDKPWIKRSESV